MTHQQAVIQAIQSYPTKAGAAKSERMSAGFLKLHTGPVVHYFTEARDEHFHTHPFIFETHIIVGGYSEEILLPNGDGTYHVETVNRLPGTSHFMPLNLPHRLVGLLDGPCLTRCEYGPTMQKPGFVQLDEQNRAWYRDWDEAKWRPYIV